VPELVPESDAVEDLPYFLGGSAAVVRREPVSVPRLGQLPGLLQRQGLASGPELGLAPRVHRLLRPEEQDVRSGEDQVVVPVPERQREVDDAVVPLQQAVHHRQVRWRAVFGVLCLDLGV
jgi:hypothetical protein